MKSKIIIGFCFIALLMFGAVLAQTNTNNQHTNSNTNNQSNSNSNTFNTIQAKQKREHEFESQVACQYLTKVEAKLILEKEVYANGNLTSYIDKNYYCNYSAVDEKSKKSASIRLDIKFFATKPEAEKAIGEKVDAAQLIKSKILNSDIGNAQTLTGIGDSAKLINFGNDSVHLYFRKDMTAFELSVSNLKYKKMTLKKMKLLAEKVAENFSETKAEQK